MRLIDTDVLPNYKCKVAATIGDKTSPAWMRFSFWEDIEKAPTIDAAPVVHGRWIEHVHVDEFGDCIYIDHKCSKCDVAEHFEDDGVRAFCPNCGAKMDGKEG